MTDDALRDLITTLQRSNGGMMAAGLIEEEVTPLLQRSVELMEDIKRELEDLNRTLCNR